MNDCFYSCSDCCSNEGLKLHNCSSNHLKQIQENVYCMNILLFQGIFQVITKSFNCTTQTKIQTINNWPYVINIHLSGLTRMDSYNCHFTQTPKIQNNHKKKMTVPQFHYQKWLRNKQITLLLLSKCTGNSKRRGSSSTIHARKISYSTS